MIEQLELHRIFISYEDKTGLALATALRAALRKEGVEGWVWEVDHLSGYVFAEIAKRISEADYICWVCTEESTSSEGQEWEIENAFAQRKAKRSWVVASDRKYVPLALKGYYQYKATLDDVNAVVRDWVSRCREGFPGWPSVVQDIADIKVDEGTDIGPTELLDYDK